MAVGLKERTGGGSVWVCDVVAVGLEGRGGGVVGVGFNWWVGGVVVVWLQGGAGGVIYVGLEARACGDSG